MILQNVEISFATLFRDARLQTEDPTTGKSYSQARVGDLLGVSDSLVSQWESGDRTPSVDMVNAIPKVLPLTVTAICRSLGYEVEEAMPHLMEDERELLAAYRRLRGSPILQETALRVVRAMPVPPTGPVGRRFAT